MAKKFKNLDIVLTAVTGPLSKGFKKAETLTKEFSGKVSSFLAGPGGIGGAIGGALAGVTVAAGIKYAVGKFSELEQSTSSLKLNLAASGNAASVAISQVSAFATQLSQSTRFSAAATTEAAASVARFSQIKGGNFQETIKQAQNFATVMGKDLTSASTELASALSNPREGYLELAAAGVRFSESQIDAIQKLQAGGDVAGAQTVILEALAAQYGGAAEAAGGTLAGSLDNLWNSFANVAAIIGEAVGPAIKGAADLLTEYVQGLDNTQTKSSVWEFTAKAVGFVADTVQSLGIAWTACQVAADALIWGVTKGFEWVLRGIRYAIQGVADLMAWFGIASDGSETALDGMIDSLHEFADAAAQVADKDLAKLEAKWNAPWDSSKTDNFFKNITTSSVKAATEMKAAIDKGPNAAMKQLTKLEIEAQGEATKLVRDLEMQIENFGLDDWQKKTKELQKKGATAGQIKQVEQLGALLKGKDLAQSLETPFEKFEREMRKLESLRDAGGVDDVTYDRAKTKLTKDLMESAPEDKVAAGGALSAGSQEARSAILAYQGLSRRNDPALAQLKIQERMAEDQKLATQYLRKLATGSPALLAAAF